MMDTMALAQIELVWRATPDISPCAPPQQYADNANTDALIALKGPNGARRGIVPLTQPYMANVRAPALLGLMNPVI